MFLGSFAGGFPRCYPCFCLVVSVDDFAYACVCRHLFIFLSSCEVRSILMLFFPFLLISRLTAWFSTSIFASGCVYLFTFAPPSAEIIRCDFLIFLPLLLISSLNRGFLVPSPSRSAYETYSFSSILKSLLFCDNRWMGIRALKVFRLIVIYPSVCRGL